MGASDDADQTRAIHVASLGDSTAVCSPQHARLGAMQNLASRASARCSPVQGPQSKRIKSDRTFPVAATAEARFFDTPALMHSYSPQEALKGFHEDHDPIRADDPLDPVVKGNDFHSDLAFQPLPLQQSLEGHSMLTNSSGKLCISNSAPEPMLASIEGDAQAR